MACKILLEQSGRQDVAEEVGSRSVTICRRAKSLVSPLLPWGERGERSQGSWVSGDVSSLRRGYYLEDHNI